MPKPRVSARRIYKASAKPQARLPDSEDDTVVVPQEGFIAVMGVTGSRKSTFIRTATEDETIPIRRSMRSCTSHMPLIPIYENVVVKIDCLTTGSLA